MGNRDIDTIPPHILIVDDDLPFANLVSRWLQRANYQTTAVYSGEEALGALGLDAKERSPSAKPPTLETPPFDLILLDIMMPGIKGTQVCRLIRANARTAQVPVLILTALSSPNERIKALEAGANDFITKPFQSAELLARVNNLVSWRRAELQAQAEIRQLYARERQRVAELTALTKELERSQAQLIQSEKLAAAGRLAASLAHEINNPLQAIHNCLTLTQRFSLETTEHADFLQLAGEEVERLIGIVQRILEFCRPSRSHRTSTDVNDLIRRVVTLAQKKLHHSEIELDLVLAPDLPPIHVVADQVSQVILNLIINAIEAMPDGGTLCLESRRVDQWVEISVSDDGPGLTAEQVDHLFEPFFTTKTGGTGLGLAISFGIAERHGSAIQVASTPGTGTTFTTRWPVALPGERND